MDQYLGVYIKLVLKNGNVVRGSVYGKDESSNLILQNASIESPNGVNTTEEMLTIGTQLIKELDVLDMNPKKKQIPTPEEQMKQQQQQQQYIQMKQQQLQQQQLQQQQMQQQHLQQEKQRQKLLQVQQQQKQLQEQQQKQQQQQQQQMKQQEQQKQLLLQKQQLEQQLKYQQEQLQQQVYQQMQYQQHHHLMQSQPQMSHMDPAILYQHSTSSNVPRDPAILSTQMEKLNIRDTPNHLDPAILFTQNMPPISNPQQESSFKSLDPSTLFQEKKPTQTNPFQDPAIISMTNISPHPIEEAPKKPLFGGKKVQKVAKEMVIFEDYSEFESGKGTVKKLQPKRNIEKKKRTSPVNEVTRQLDNKQNMVPISLIPPKARRSGSITPQPYVSDPVVVEPCRILTVSGGIQIPTVTLNHMENAKRIAADIGFTKSQLIENGAFGISAMVLKAIGGDRRIQPDNHNAAPVVVILTGPTYIGEFGIAAARHLANRGCQVIISIPEESNEPTVKQYESLAKLSGARIVTSIQELPNQYTTPVDVIVDALLGAETKKISAAVKSQMSWANANKAPVLSIDFPSGVNANNGAFPANHYITPKWTLCLSAPYTGCTSRNVTGELFLADAGLPFYCFQSVGRNFHIPWGSDFVLALEYA